MNFIEDVPLAITEEAFIPGISSFRDEHFGVLSFNPLSIRNEITEEEKTDLRNLFDSSKFWTTIRHLVDRTCLPTKLYYCYWNHLKNHVMRSQFWVGNPVFDKDLLKASVSKLLPPQQGLVWGTVILIFEHTFKAVNEIVSSRDYPAGFVASEAMEANEDLLKGGLLKHFGNSLYDTDFVQKQCGRT